MVKTILQGGPLQWGRSNLHSLVDVDGDIPQLLGFFHGIIWHREKTLRLPIFCCGAGGSAKMKDVAIRPDTAPIVLLLKLLVLVSALTSRS